MLILMAAFSSKSKRLDDPDAIADQLNRSRRDVELRFRFLAAKAAETGAQPMGATDAYCLWSVCVSAEAHRSLRLRADTKALICALLQQPHSMRTGRGQKTSKAQVPDHCSSTHGDRPEQSFSWPVDRAVRASSDPPALLRLACCSCCSCGH